MQKLRDSKSERLEKKCDEIDNLLTAAKYLARADESTMSIRTLKKIGRIIRGIN